MNYFSECYGPLAFEQPETPEDASSGNSHGRELSELPEKSRRARAETSFLMQRGSRRLQEWHDNFKGFWRRKTSLNRSHKGPFYKGKASLALPCICCASKVLISNSKSRHSSSVALGDKSERTSILLRFCGASEPSWSRKLFSG